MGLPHLTDSFPYRGADPQAGEFDQLDAVIQRLRIGDDSATSDLVSLLEAGAVFLLRRSTGENRRHGDTVLRILLRAAEQARAGQFRNGHELAQSVLRSVRAAAATYTVRPLVAKDTAVPGLTEALSEMDSLDREVLRRYYVLRHEPDVICEQLAVTPERFTAILNQVRRKTVRREEGHGQSQRWGASL